jgi:hypothetical protein
MDGVSHPRDEVIAIRVEEDLGLVLESSERLGVNDPATISLESGAELVVIFVLAPTLRLV